jgi:hypothetical protein
MAFYETLFLTSGGNICNHTVVEILLYFGKSVLIVQALPEKMFCETNELFGHILSIPIHVVDINYKITWLEV